MKQGFETAGRFIKKYGPTGAKFGLKIISAVQSVAARVVKYVPVVVLLNLQGSETGVQGLNKASDAIHAELSPQLKKGSEILDDIRHPFGESFVQPRVSWQLS